MVAKYQKMTISLDTFNFGSFLWYLMACNGIVAFAVLMYNCCCKKKKHTPPSEPQNRSAMEASDSESKNKSHEDKSHEDVPKAVKVCSSDRKRRIGVVAANLEQLSLKCRQKFDLKTEDTFKFHLEDGTEVDDEFFETLSSGVVLMMLKGTEEWTGGFTGEKPTEIKPDDSSGGRYPTRVMSILQELKKKHKKTDDKPSVKDQSRKISVQLGWMNFSYKDQRYIIIKSTKDHPDSGPRLYKVESSLTVQGLLPKLKDIFFPGHKSPLGSEKKFHFSVGNFNGDMLEPSMTLGEYTQGTSKQRMYLLSKQIPTWSIHSESSSDSDFELPSITVQPNKRHRSTKTVTFADASEKYCPSLPDLGTTEQTVSFQQNQEVSFRMQDEECCLCRDRKKESFFVPCGHKFCTVCAMQIDSTSKCCPCCTVKIISIGHLRD